ncbi:MAG: 3-hydroxyacyl-CoA dehydrogenase family protein [Ginsengibacter sp.]
MRLFFNVDREQEKEIRIKYKLQQEYPLTFSNALPRIEEYKDHDVFFILGKNFDLNFEALNGKPVFINSTTSTLRELNLPKNVSRINGWNGFLEREIWEVATLNEELVNQVFNFLNWKLIFVKDEPGLVSARVIAMIINEAFYALHEKISSRQEIDLAMKLGTNYPMGPFEWAEKIGLEKVHSLLSILSENDERYIPAFELSNQ